MDPLEGWTLLAIANESWKATLRSSRDQVDLIRHVNHHDKHDICTTYGSPASLVQVIVTSPPVVGLVGTWIWSAETKGAMSASALFPGPSEFFETRYIPS